MVHYWVITVREFRWGTLRIRFLVRLTGILAIIMCDCLPFRRKKKLVVQEKINMSKAKPQQPAVIHKVIMVGSGGSRKISTNFTVHVRWGQCFEILNVLVVHGTILSIMCVKFQENVYFTKKLIRWLGMASPPTLQNLWFHSLVFYQVSHCSKNKCVTNI